MPSPLGAVTHGCRRTSSHGQPLTGAALSFGLVLEVSVAVGKRHFTATHGGTFWACCRLEPPAES